MRSSIKLLVLAIVISTYSCSRHVGYVITGEVSGFPDSTMLYLVNLSTDETFDSALVIANKFQLKGQLLDEPEEIWLHGKVGNHFVYCNLLIGNENIRVEGDITDFPWNVKVAGSKSQDDHDYLRDLTKAFQIKRDSLVRDLFQMSDDQQSAREKAIWDMIQLLDDTTSALELDFVKTHINTYPAVIILGYLKNTLPKDTVQALYNKLTPKIKASKYARTIEVYLREKISEVGDSYHDFKALSSAGDTVQFSSLIGKYILLDFTAASCGGCIQSAEELRLISSEYADSLSIVSFSCDANKEIWLKSLQRDSTSWVSLWDGKGRYSETYIKYGVSGVPTFFLIDPAGKIIDRWGGYGKGSLERKLARFKNK